MLANLVPFRGPLEPDSGTAFEVGMAIALGKPVAGIVPTGSEPIEDRVARQCGRRRDAQGMDWDLAQGMLIESFGLPLNLMLACSARLFADEASALAHLARELGA